MSEQWYYSKGDQKHGPVTAETLKELAASGHLLPSDLIWKEGMQQWAKGASVKGLFPDALQAGSPLPPQKKDEPPPLPSVTTATQPPQTIDQASLRQKSEGLRQSIVQHVLNQQADLPNNETIASFRKEHSNLQEQLKQHQDRLQQLGKGKTAYELLEDTCQQKSKELATAETNLQQFAQPLGKAAFESFVAGQIQNQPILNERFSVHKQIAERQTEYGQLAPANDAGMIQKTKAKAQQLVVTVKIKLEEMKINMLEEQIGKQLINSSQEDSVRCDHTAEILAKVAKQRGIIATCKEAFNKAREILDNKKQELCQSLKLANIDGSKSFSTFQQQCLVQISQIEKQQNTLEKNLPDRLLADEVINDQGALGQLLPLIRCVDSTLKNKENELKQYDISKPTVSLPGFKTKWKSEFCIIGGLLLISSVFMGWEEISSNIDKIDTFKLEFRSGWMIVIEAIVILVIGLSSLAEKEKPVAQAKVVGLLSLMTLLYALYTAFTCWSIGTQNVSNIGLTTYYKTKIGLWVAVFGSILCLIWAGQYIVDEKNDQAQ